MCAVARQVAATTACAADMSALPLRSGALSGLVCMYAVIHLDSAGRDAAYDEFARVLLRDDGVALIAFHTKDSENRTGESRHVNEWWGHDVDLTFHFLDPAQEISRLQQVGLRLIARLDRSPHVGLEHESHRSYLIVQGT